MKKWHFKKWFQHIIEFITASCIILLMGISSIDFTNKWSFVVVAGLILTAITGGALLSKYGR